MARTPMVTRTIQTTHCSVLCMDIAEREPVNIDVVLPRTYKDETAMLKAVKKVAETDTVKCVQVVSYHVQETLYGMPESEFITHAKPMPPRSVESQESNTTEG